MFAISFDMVIVDLKTFYGEPYNNAYFEIGKVLRKYEFYNTQGSVYLSTKNDMANLTRAMIHLKSIDWFRNSVRDIRAFKVEDWSDFTQFMKE
ncbi:virulence protein [Flavobacterium aurantiibacter]|uniref:Endoribonuclease VapD n=1 Tax=Flavobacterium aurantiibacter TaxID=2023067 RepID=A0A256A4L9_9FLAO|nr:virulence protein [Flavobacterium aurantiibacter]OYQ48676.1 virulence protein [Flavobacterium aurantiibacter]